MINRVAGAGLECGLLGLLLSYRSLCGKRGLVGASAHVPALIGACGFGSYDCACLRIYYDATAVSEIHVVGRGAVLIKQPGMVHGIAGAGGKCGLLGLLLSYRGLCALGGLGCLGSGHRCLC